MDKELILKFEAPLMSFGTEAAQWDTYKDTAFEPTKSAVIGMVGCAFGYQRYSDELKSLYDSLSVEVIGSSSMGNDISSESNFFDDYKDDEESFFNTLGCEILDDFQIVSTKRYDQFVLDEKKRGFLRGDGKYNVGLNIVHKQYLEDISFQLRISGDEKLISDVYYALRHPYYPYYLGRACCIPSAWVVKKKE